MELLEHRRVSDRAGGLHLASFVGSSQPSALSRQLFVRCHLARFRRQVYSGAYRKLLILRRTFTTHRKSDRRQADGGRPCLEVVRRGDVRVAGREEGGQDLQSPRRRRLDRRGRTVRAAAPADTRRRAARAGARRASPSPPPPRRGPPRRPRRCTLPRFRGPHRLRGQRCERRKCVDDDCAGCERCAGGRGSRGGGATIVEGQYRSDAMDERAAAEEARASQNDAWFRLDLAIAELESSKSRRSARQGTRGRSRRDGKRRTRNHSQPHGSSLMTRIESIPGPSYANDERTGTESSPR